MGNRLEIFFFIYSKKTKLVGPKATQVFLADLKKKTLINFESSRSHRLLVLHNYVGHSNLAASVGHRVGNIE